MRPRKILKTEPGDFIIEAPSPGYNCILIEGAFDGILKMLGIHDADIKQTKCVRNGDDTCIYQVRWKQA